MEKYLEDDRIVVCMVLDLEKDKELDKLKPFEYSEKEKDAILRLGILLERFYQNLGVKPDDFEETNEYRSYVSEDFRLQDIQLNMGKEPGQWPLPNFLMTKYGRFGYFSANKYQVEFSNHEGFNLSFGLLIRNLQFAEVRRLFNLYHKIHKEAFVEFLEIHIIEYSYFFENSTLPTFIEKWIDSKKSPSKISTPESPQDSKPAYDSTFVVPKIVFDEKIIDDLFEVLKTFFPNQHGSLLKALKGEALSQKLVFMSRANRLAYVFTQLQDSGKIISDAQTTKQWICDNFQFIEKQTPKNFKINTVQSVFNLSLPVSKKNIIDISSLLKY